MPIDSITDARTFVLVVEAGSLSAAARAMQVSPNAVSQRIRGLEARTGARLLNRTTRSMSLTEEGETFYRGCLRILAEVDATEARMAASPDALAGRVRVAVPTAASGAFTMDALRDLRTVHPALSVQLIVTDDRSLDLAAAGIDLAFRYGEPPDSGLILRRIGDAAFALCATPAYLDARGRPASPSDLAGHDTLRFLDGLPQATWRLTDPDGRDVEAAVGGWFESDDSRALGDAVYAGLGIGVRPEREVEATPRLERVLPGWRFGRAPIVALMAPGRHRLPRVRAVLDALAEALADHILVD